MSDRIEWLDIAKGIGIIFVIFAHVITISPALLNYIYSFHMPLFFFISGYVFSDTKYKTLKSFAKKKAQTLLIPYAAFSIFSFLYWVLIQIRMGDDIKHPDILRAFTGIFYSDSNYYSMDYNPALWFLTCLFCTEIIFFFIKKIEKKYYLAIILFLFSILGYLYSIYSPPFILPWGIDTAFNAVVFYGTGYLFKTINKEDYLLERFSKIPAVLLFIPLNYFLSQINQDINMALNILNNYFLFYSGAFLGIFSWISISYLVKSSRFLSYVGKNSLIVFGLHLKIPVDFFNHRILGINAKIVNGTLYGVIDTVITLMALLPVIWIINRFFPFIIGKSKELKDEIILEEDTSVKD
jgi:fucose 4-O-acetylase-like acetyltransferase